MDNRWKDEVIEGLIQSLILRERDDCIETCVRRAESLREGSSVAYQCAQDIKMRKKP